MGMNAVDELLLHFRGEHRRAEGLPPGGHRAGKLLEEVLDAARTAAEMVEHHVAHNAPAQARAPAQGGVDVGGAHHTLAPHVVNPAPHYGLHTVTHLATHPL